MAQVDRIRFGRRIPDAPTKAAVGLASVDQVELPWTTLDPDVPFSHEQSLAAIVAKAGYSSKLRQQSYNRYGHCNFSPAETVDAFFRLVNWVEYGVKPVSGALAP